MDLSKAFDTVNHSSFLKKIEIYGIHGKSLEWLKSYLRNRKQYIQIDDNNKIDFLSVTSGVAQGSILRPLLFLLYVNPIQERGRGRGGEGGKKASPTSISPVTSTNVAINPKTF